MKMTEISALVLDQVCDTENHGGADDLSICVTIMSRHEAYQQKQIPGLPGYCLRTSHGRDYDRVVISR